MVSNSIEEITIPKNPHVVHGLPKLDNIHHYYARWKPTWRTQEMLKNHLTLPESVQTGLEYLPFPKRSPHSREAGPRIRKKTGTGESEEDRRMLCVHLCLSKGSDAYLPSAFSQGRDAYIPLTTSQNSGISHHHSHSKQPLPTTSTITMLFMCT